MHDQAKELRQLVRQRIAAAAAADRLARPRLIVVSSGKGGAGATTAAVGLATALVRRGRRTALVDADPHGGDAALLCGVQERFTLADALSGRRTVRESLQPGPQGIRVLPGAWGQSEPAQWPTAAQERLLGQLQELGDEVDCLVIDAGNGLSRLVHRLWLAADAVLVVTTAELASVMAAYGSIKVLAAGNGSIPLRLLVSMAPSAAAAEDVHARLACACRRFLGIHLSSAGHLAREPAAPTVAEAAAPGSAGGPLGIAASGCRAAEQLQQLAATLATKATIAEGRSLAAVNETSMQHQPD